MSNLFSLDSKLFDYGNRIADLILLNIITIICSIPIITIGASYSAMHYTLYQMYKKNESHIINDYFTAFKRNLKQGTFIWLVYILIGLVLLMDYYITMHGNTYIYTFLWLALLFVTLLFFFSLCWVFILLARYENTVLETIKNSFIIGTSQWAYTIGMCFLAISPMLLNILFPPTIGFTALIGLTIPGYLQAYIYDRVFKKCEN